MVVVMVLIVQRVASNDRLELEAGESGARLRLDDAGAARVRALHDLGAGRRRIPTADAGADQWGAAVALAGDGR